MGKNTKIQWAHHTHNPWHGCEKYDPQCKNCFAKATDARWCAADPHWGKRMPRRFFGDEHWNKPRLWDRAAAAAGERHRVFCGSMCDWAEDRRDLDPWRARLWGLIRETRNLDWLMLTKRVEHLHRFVPWVRGRGGRPWPNVWIGFSAGDTPRFNECWRHVSRIPAVVRFCSYEPALGPLDISAVDREPGRLDWLIGGSESGRGVARPADHGWYRWARDQCESRKIAFFLKQYARKGVKIPLPRLDGRQHVDFPTPRQGV